MSILSYLNGIAGMTANINGQIWGQVSDTITIPANVFGAIIPSYLIPGYMYGFDYGNITIDAYTAGALVMPPVSINAYINPIKLHTISIPAFLNTEIFTDPNGNIGFGILYNNEVVLTDLAYNKVSTLVCDYYMNTPSPIVFNLLLANGTRYNVSNIRIMTNSTWANNVFIQHGANIQYLTDSYDTTAIFTDTIESDNAMPVIITVINPVIAYLTTIPIYIINGV